MEAELEILPRTSALLASVTSFCIYVHYKSELKTESIIKWGLENNKKVIVPKVDVESNEIIPVQIHDLDDLEIGYKGIPEPKCIAAFSVKEIEVCFVPLLGFTKEFFRIGYGGGFYDRFLPRLSNDCIKIGLAYKEQLIDSLPVEEHDVVLDRIVSF